MSAYIICIARLHAQNYQRLDVRTCFCPEPKSGTPSKGCHFFDQSWFDLNNLFNINCGYEVLAYKGLLDSKQHCK